MRIKKDGEWLLSSCQRHAERALIGNKMLGLTAEDLASDACYRVLRAKSCLEDVYAGYIKRAVESVIIDLSRKHEILLDPATRSLDDDPCNLQDSLPAKEDTFLDAMMSLDEESLSDVEARIRRLVMNLKFRSLNKWQKHHLEGLIRDLEKLGSIVMTRKELSEYLCVGVRTIDSWKRSGCVSCLGGATRTLYSLPETLRKLVMNRGKPGATGSDGAA